MSLFSNKALGFLALLIAFLFACEKRRAPNNSSSKKQLSALQEIESAANNQRKTAEEEIKYFFHGGHYNLYIYDLIPDDYYNSKWHIRPENIEENMNVADQKGNVVDIKNILKLVTTEIDDEPLFESKTNIEGYKS